MPVFFLDEWRPYSQRSTLITGIYMYLSNSKSVSRINVIYMYDILIFIQDTPRIYLIGIVSPIPKDEYNEKWREIAEIVLVKYAIQLEEEGIDIMLADGRVIHGKGTIHSILGDHMGQSVSQVLVDLPVIMVACECSSISYYLFIRAVAYTIFSDTAHVRRQSIITCIVIKHVMPKTRSLETVLP
jgi:hypothetical protein